MFVYELNNQNNINQKTKIGGGTVGGDCRPLRFEKLMDEKRMAAAQMGTGLIGPIPAMIKQTEGVSVKKFATPVMGC